MTRLFIFTLLFISLCFTNLPGQEEIQHDFQPRSPIAHPIILSGSFGELRSNHFHAGIDIKSSKWNQSGDPIYAVEDGYISRINVRGEGYGNALYIDHPHGYTTVYGHLDRYTDTLNVFVKQQQYQLKRFKVNLFPDSTHFIVKKGDLIGFMGNTGRSSAAHLHFEIRHLNSEKPINPLLFGIGPADTRHPTLLNINFVHLLPDTTIVSQDRQALKYISPGNYKLAKDTIELNAWRTGIELHGFDRMNGASNKNGIYEILMRLNGDLVYQYKLDSFSFEEFRHLNAHINYMDYHELKRRYQRCYVLPADPLSIYQLSDSLQAIIPLYKSQKQHVEITAKDMRGNESKLEFWLKRKAPMSAPPPLNYNYKLQYGKSHLIRDGSYILYFPDSSLYQNAYLHITESDTIEAPLASKQVFIHANNIFKNKVDLFIKTEHIPDSLLSKACIVSCGGKKLTSFGGNVFEDYITTKFMKFGDFSIFLDTIAPKITPVKFSPGLNYSKISFKISDNVKTSGKARSLRFNGYIDDEWVLFQYDAKTSTIFHEFEKNLKAGQHQLRLELIDDRDNTTIFEQKFTKK